MKLSKENYSGDIHKKIIVSAENGKSHVAKNPSGKYEVRHYRLDGEIVKYEKCCDFLLLNDSLLNAYFIELKGCDFIHAVEQVQAAEQIFKEDVANYTKLYRIVTSKTRTQDFNSAKFRHFQRSVGKENIICKTNKIEETL